MGKVRFVAIFAALFAMPMLAAAETSKPNILVIWGDASAASTSAPTTRV